MIVLTHINRVLIYLVSASGRHGPASSPQNGIGGGVQPPVLRDGQRGDGNPSRVYVCRRPQFRQGGFVRPVTTVYECRPGQAQQPGQPAAGAVFQCPDG